LSFHDLWAQVNQFIDNGEQHWATGFRNPGSSPEQSWSAINSSELLTKSNYQDFQRFQVTDIGMTGRCRGIAAVPDRGRLKSALPNDKEGGIRKSGLRSSRKGGATESRPHPAGRGPLDGMRTRSRPRGLSAELWAAGGRVRIGRW